MYNMIFIYVRCCYAILHQIMLNNIQLNNSFNSYINHWPLSLKIENAVQLIGPIYPLCRICNWEMYNLVIQFRSGTSLSIKLNSRSTYVLYDLYDIRAKYE